MLSDKSELPGIWLPDQAPDPHVPEASQNGRRNVTDSLHTIIDD